MMTMITVIMTMMTQVMIIITIIVIDRYNDLRVGLWHVLLINRSN